MPDEECPEKIRLVEKYREAQKAYALKVGELLAQIGKIDESQYDALNDAVNRARAVASDARAQLKHHTVDHQC